MKTPIICIIIFTLFGFSNGTTVSHDVFVCTITSAKKTYKPGETPQISVSVTNNSGNDVYLLGSLDGSEEKMRSPYCYFKIDKPKKVTPPVVMRCGYMNRLRKTDFVLVRSGEAFDPYRQLDMHGFFSSDELRRTENFLTPGMYQITFHYSTKSTRLKDYVGSDQNTELMELFDQIAHVELKSNTVEIEITE